MNMIEKVARAICKSKNIDPEAKIALGQPMYVNTYPHINAYYVPSETNQYPAWIYFKVEAKAAIEAMKEPPLDDNYKFEMISPAYQTVWKAMIEAALKE